MKKQSRIVAILSGVAVGGAAALFLSRRRITSGIKLKKSIIVDRTPEELYRYWRNLENLPNFVEILESVEVLDQKHSRWTILAPAGVRMTWDAEITIDRENEMIGWVAAAGSSVETAGYVRFERAPGGRGTVVRVALEYNPPGGKIGAAVSSLLGKRPSVHIEEALRRFKQLMETGEIATAREKIPVRKPLGIEVPHSTEPVEAASEDSFPASDAPAWTGTAGM
jgi:uncharacterized membrane protein